MSKIIFIYPQRSIKLALKKIRDSGVGTVVVVDKDKKLLGTLSDGDIRNKALLKNLNTSSTIEGLYNKKPKFFVNNEFKKSDIKKILIQKQYGLIPIVNKKRKVLRIIIWDNFFKKKIEKKKYISKSTVVIMAGGIGSRMRPFTHVLPKPLIPMKDKPMIDHIIESFYNYGIRNFILTINHKAKIIKSYFKESKNNFKIRFTEEKKPLGTAGGLKLIEGKITNNFFVTNCDTLFKFNFNKMLEFHKKNKFSITLASSLKTHKIPYGACKVDNDGMLKSIKEKPKFKFLINTGIYVLNKKILKLLRKNKYFDMTDLINVCIKKNIKVGLYQIKNNFWIDMGHLKQYQKIVEKI